MLPSSRLFLSIISCVKWIFKNKNKNEDLMFFYHAPQLLPYRANELVNPLMLP